MVGYADRFSGLTGWARRKHGRPETPMKELRANRYINMEVLLIA
jgi:hypothetical protein